MSGVGLCAPVNISAVADDIGVSSSSVRRRLDELREAFVVWPCYGRWRRDAQTLRASGWRGIVATRSELNLDDPQVAAVPVALLAWLVDS